jgi:1-acyl-sn-glycerol-3-phosphate acyltransferase
MTESDPRRTYWRPPALWRVLQLVARVLAALVGRLRVTGDVPDELRRGPLILAGNHIGNFDPIALSAATGVIGVHPRIMATGGLFRAPVVGAVLRACGHIRVNRTRVSAAEAVAAAAIDEAAQALAEGSVVAGYPEGRITLDPGMWPERGRSGMARLALTTGAAVVPVVQWGSHEILRYEPRDALLRTVIRVHFGKPVDLTGLNPHARGDVQRATDRIIAALRDELVALRPDEPDLPRFADPSRRVETRRSFGSPSPVLDVRGDDLPGTSQVQQAS